MEAVVQTAAAAAKDDSEDFDLIGEREVWEASGPKVMKENILAKEDSAIQGMIDRINQSHIQEKVGKMSAGTHMPLSLLYRSYARLKKGHWCSDPFSKKMLIALFLQQISKKESNFPNKKGQNF